MKDLILIGFFCASLFCYPQSEEDQVIDSILDELFETEASPVDFSQSHFLYTSFSFDESVFFAGRNFGIDQFGFTPSISYMKGKSFFVSLGAAYFSELDPQWDFVSLSSGYSFFLNKEEQLSLTALYSRIFFSTETEDLNPNRFSVALSLQKNSWGARMSGGYLFGGSASFYTAAATHFVIPIKKIKNAATAITVSDNDSFNKVTRVYFALKQMRAENNWDSLAVQCWSQFQELYGIAPCMAYGWMGSEDGIAVSCEGDVQGAISMLLLNYISNTEKSSTLLDLATFDKEADAVLMWHCGVSPRHFANEDGIKWVDHSTLGRKTEKKYGIAGDQVFKPQSSTTAYLGNNASRLLILNSEIFNHTNKGYDGTRGWFKETKLNRTNISAENLINTLNMVGHEHHYAVGQGDHSKELLEFAAWNDLKLVEEIPLVDYISPKDNESNNLVI